MKIGGRHCYQSHHLLRPKGKPEAGCRLLKPDTASSLRFRKSWLVSAVAVHHGAELLFLGINLCTQALAAFLHFGSKLCAKIFRFEYRTDLAF
jgi:hypothetical protein